MKSILKKNLYMKITILLQFQNFVKSLNDQGQDILDKDRITETIEHNIQWLETNGPIIEAWLQEENMM